MLLIFLPEFSFFLEFYFADFLFFFMKLASTGKTLENTGFTLLNTSASACLPFFMKNIFACPNSLVENTEFLNQITFQF
jgi:hypothetical protein